MARFEAEKNHIFRGACKTSCMGGAASSLPAICRRTGNEDVVPLPGFASVSIKRCLDVKVVYNLVLLQTKVYTNEHQGNTENNDIMLRTDNQ